MFISPPELSLNKLSFADSLRRIDGEQLFLLYN